MQWWNSLEEEDVECLKDIRHLPDENHVSISVIYVMKILKNWQKQWWHWWNYNPDKIPNYNFGFCLLGSNPTTVIMIIMVSMIIMSWQLTSEESHSISSVLIQHTNYQNHQHDYHIMTTHLRREPLHQPVWGKKLVEAKSILQPL